jgi:LmbE family N-acetylglucosaminyl deacetylase
MAACARYLIGIGKKAPPMRTRPGTRPRRHAAPFRSLLATLLLLPLVSLAVAATPPPEDFRFAAGSSSVQAITLTRTTDGVRFDWPAIPAWDTALLGVRSEGAEIEPYAEVTAGSARLTQYFDPHALGPRWLNLSALHGIAAGTAVSVHAHGITLDVNAVLRSFDNHLDLHQRLLIIAPHPDDAEIAAFGLYADRSSTIVTLTSGNAGDMNYRAEVSDPAEHYRWKGTLRATDSVTVPWQGGISPEHTFNLGYFDARLEEMHDAPDKVFAEVYGPNTDVAVYRHVNLGALLPTDSRSNSWKHLVEDLVTILRKVDPALIVTPDPRLDGHPDHKFATVALAQALDQWGGSARFLLYTNHFAENRYPFGPAGTVMTLPVAGPQWLQGVYSYPTPAALQLRKAFALESMHDLRLSPEEQRTCGIPGLERRQDYPRIPEEDYLRRAPRENELFYVYDREGLRQVVKDYLKSRSATESRP